MGVRWCRAKIAGSLAIYLFVLLGGVSVSAGDDEFRLFKLRDWDGYLLFQAEMEEYESGATTTASRHFTEQLFLGMDGSLYHPKLFDFRLGGLMGYSNDEYTRNGTADSNSGKVLGYEFEAHVLKEKWYGVTVFAEDRRQWLPRAFLPSYRLDTIERGIRWQVAEPWLFSKLEISELEYDYDRYDPYTNSDRNVKDFRVQYDADIRFNRNNALELDYDYLEREDSLSQTETDTSDFLAVHKLWFGKDYADELQSSYRYYEQNSGVELIRHTFAEHLHLEHSETLDSWYDLGYETTDFLPIGGGASTTTTRQSGGASVRHKLYDSLISRVGGRVQHTEFGNTAIIDSTEGYGSLNYKKTNSWGHLYVNYNYSHQVEDSDLKQVTNVSVFDETYTFDVSDQITIETDNVISGTIIITDLTGTITYLEGLDYNPPLVLADRVIITRINIGGTIAAGQSVLVDYDYSPTVGSETTTQTQRAEIGQYFSNGLRTYITQQDKIVDRDPKLVADTDSLITTFGMDYRKQAFYATAEYETEEKSYPYDSTRATVSYSIPVTDRLKTSISGSWSDTTYTGQLTRDVERYNATWRNYYRLNNYMNMTGTLIYRDETDTLYGDAEGLDLVAALDWRYRKTSVRLEYLSKYYDSDNLDYRSNEIRFTFKRVF